MNPNQESSLSRSDRDMIITLNVKVDRLITDVKDIKDDTAVRIAKIENRLDSIDKYHASIDVPKLLTLAEWVEDLKANMKVIVFVASLIGFMIETIILILIHKYLGI